VTCVGQVFHYTGFFSLVLLQDAVSLGMVFMTLIMGTVSLAQVGVANGCDGVPLLSEDASCTASMQNVSAFVAADVLYPATSCSQANVLICENLLTDMSLVYRTLMAAIIGTVVWWQGMEGAAISEAVPILDVVLHSTSPAGGLDVGTSQHSNC